jgi:glycosyltransferase involved in cell wall biosynthesis
MYVKRIGGTGGLQIQARQVTRALMEMGVACEVVSHERRPLIPDTGRTPEGVPLHILVDRKSPGFYVQLLRFMRERRREYDLVHVHGFGEDSLVGALAAWRAGGKPVVVKPSTAGPGTKLARWGAIARRVPPLGALMRAGVARWVAISRQTQDDLLRLGVRPEQVALIPNGVDTAAFRPGDERERGDLRDRFAVPAGAPVAVCISRLSPHKRVDLLVRALAQLRPDLPAARLWIIGQGAEREALERLARACGVADRVQFLGAIDRQEVAERLRAADVLVLCSIWEGLSNALLEAMATALPVLATRVSGTEDVVTPGENGLLIPPDSEADLAAGLRRLALDTALSHRLGRQARDTVIERYSLEATARSLIRLYQDCLCE